MGRFAPNDGPPSVGRDDAADMHFSDHDILQLDDDYLHGLPVDPLRSLSKKLLADLKEAHDRLNQNPSNSSRPPSTRAPWEKDDSGLEEGGHGVRRSRGQCGLARSRVLAGVNPAWVIVRHEPSIEPCGAAGNRRVDV